MVWCGVVCVRRGGGGGVCVCVYVCVCVCVCVCVRACECETNRFVCVPARLCTSAATESRASANVHL